MLLLEICDTDCGTEKDHIIISFEALEPSPPEVLRCYNNRRTRSKRSFGHSGSSTSSRCLGLAQDVVKDVLWLL